MSRIYRYGYKLIPLYFVIIGILCAGLYWIAYPLFDYVWVNNYISDMPEHLSLYSTEAYSIINLMPGIMLILFIGIHLTLIFGGILAIYWSEFINSNIRTKGLNLIEILVNIPFVVYGYLLLILFSKIADFQENILQNMLISSIILGGMLLPKMVYKFISILQAIPYKSREGAYSLGASRYRTAYMVLIPSQTKLFIAAIINIASRAFCEILIVILIAGFTTEKLEVIVFIFIISILATIISQWLKKSHEQYGAN